VFVGLGLALAPVNAAARASAPQDARGVVSSLVVPARMVEMVVGLALLTAIGLHRYYAAVAALPNQQDTAALAAAGVVQVQTVFLGGAVAALVAALVAAVVALALGPLRWARSPGARPRPRTSTRSAMSSRTPGAYVRPRPDPLVPQDDPGSAWLVRSTRRTAGYRRY